MARIAPAGIEGWDRNNQSMETQRPSLDAVLQRSGFGDMSARESVFFIGAAIDAAWDVKRPDVLRHVAALAEQIDRRVSSPEDVALLDYCLANLWNGLKALEGSPAGGGWEWEQAETEREIVCLRRALRSPALGKLPAHRVCQMHTNLGNCYNRIGRFVEAIDEWSAALRIEPRFGMARGNYALGLWTYARSVYDDGHAIVMAREAWRELDPRLLHGLESGAGEYFKRLRAEIETALTLPRLQQAFDLNRWSIGKSKAEVAYRRWCLERRLFLNPLNDLGAHTVAARDVLTAPSIVTRIGEGPRFHGFFNQIKQEYCSARWLAFESTLNAKPHFADRDVLLYNTLDYPSYSLATEKLKLSFRALYSLFDKTAFFLNAYMRLGIPDRAVSFRNLWYTGQQRKKGIRAEFKARENLPLRGLFWLGKDLYEDAPEFRAVMDPQAEQLNEIRNHLEHKYLKLHDDIWTGSASGMMADDLAESVRRDDFLAMTLRLLALIRAAIIYVSLGVHREERQRASSRPQGQITPPMVLDTWEDGWKR